MFAGLVRSLKLSSTNGFVESSDEAASEKRREYYAGNYMDIVTTEGSDA
jgi:hypothetical protein